jgi:hypothetical protein
MLDTLSTVTGQKLSGTVVTAHLVLSCSNSLCLVVTGHCGSSEASNQQEVGNK